jgi:hypothetical protein
VRNLRSGENWEGAGQETLTSVHFWPIVFLIPSGFQFSQDLFGQNASRLFLVAGLDVRLVWPLVLMSTSVMDEAPTVS